MHTLSNKVVLVTGATGLIGSRLVEELMALGDVTVIALSRNETKIQQAFAPYLESSRFSYYAKDISSPLDMLKMPIDFIFHAAGPIAGDIVRNSPLQVILPNLLGTQNCLEFLHKQEQETGVRGRAVIFSSATVYGNQTEQDRRVTELDTESTECLHSVNAAYSQTKRMSEVIAQSYCRQYGVDVVTVRFSYVYGYTKCRPNTAFFEFIDTAMAGENLVFKGSGFPRRDNIYIDDAVAGLMCAAVKGNTGEVYNISSNAQLNNFAAIDEIAHIIADVFNRQSTAQTGKSVLVLGLENSKTRRPGLILDNSKLRLLGWDIKVELSQGVKLTIDQCKEQGKDTNSLQ